jgi:GTPase Era involved in 16S rRNA processing
VGRRAEIAPWLRDMQERHPFAEFVPMSAKNKKDIERMYGICAKYLPQQPWFYGEDELTDRSEKFLASETLREKLFRFTGDELPYTSTVVIDKFEEEPSKFGRFMRVAATIVVERDGHKAMVIGQGASASSASPPKPARSWKSCSTPRCSWKSGSRSSPAGPTTRPGQILRLRVKLFALQS